MGKYNASLRGEWFNQLNGDSKSIPCTSVTVPKRERPIDKDAVAALSEDIELKGLLQPIGVRIARDDEPGAYHLIYGAHRFQAWFNKYDAAASANPVDKEGRARWHAIPAIIFGTDVTPEMATLLELSENLVRKELTRAERKRFAAQMNRLQKTFDSTSTQTGTSTQVPNGYFKPPTYTDAAGASNTPVKTYTKWYTAYRKEIDAPAWNKQTEAQYGAWLNWLESQADKEEAAKVDQPAISATDGDAVKITQAAIMRMDQESRCKLIAGVLRQMDRKGEIDGRVPFHGSKCMVASLSIKPACIPWSDLDNMALKRFKVDLKPALSDGKVVREES